MASASASARPQARLSIPGTHASTTGTAALDGVGVVGREGGDGGIADIRRQLAKQARAKLEGFGAPQSGEEASFDLGET